MITEDSIFFQKSVISKTSNQKIRCLTNRLQITSMSVSNMARKLKILRRVRTLLTLLLLIQLVYYLEKESSKAILEQQKKF